MSAEGDILIVGGTTVRRERDWRSSVDLGNCPRHVLYAAGLEDGYHLAIAQLRDVAGLMVEHLAVARDLGAAGR